MQYRLLSFATVVGALLFSLASCQTEAPGPTGGGGPLCGNGVCEYGESNASCSYDCPASSNPVCGNNKCESGESTNSCPADCMKGPFCGDGVCSGPQETNFSCPTDCKGDTCASKTVCAGVCCPHATDACVNSTCCDPSSVCGNSCCVAGQQCVAGECCTKPCGTECCGPGTICLEYSDGSKQCEYTCTNSSECYGSKSCCAKLDSGASACVAKWTGASCACAVNKDCAAFPAAPSCAPRGSAVSAIVTGDYECSPNDGKPFDGCTGTSCISGWDCWKTPVGNEFCTKSCSSQTCGLDAYCHFDGKCTNAISDCTGFGYCAP